MMKNDLFGGLRLIETARISLVDHRYLRILRMYR